MGRLLGASKAGSKTVAQYRRLRARAGRGGAACVALQALRHRADRAGNGRGASPSSRRMTEDRLIIIGRTKWRDLDKPFGLWPEDRRAHMYVIGKTGTGKSSLLEAMVRQDVLAGNGLALFDPPGHLVDRLNALVREERRKV